ncbi:MAG: heavy-metal-associated domain-containing protein [Acidobacteriia bacterium]|nr:heavy-metal-associated domain-containing protein [Terriglobia bacterium]
MRHLILLCLAFPCLGQWESMEIRFEGVGCSSCIESLPGRLRRLRGVESAEVDAAAGNLRIRLTAENRVRLEQVRDMIEQDGTKARSAVVAGRGQLRQEGGQWLFRTPAQSVDYVLESSGSLEPGNSVAVAGVIENLRPDNGAIRIKGRITVKAP